METTSITKRKPLRQSTAFLKQNKFTWTRIYFDKITYIEAFKDSCIIHFINKKHMTCGYTLFELEAHLPYGFERVHRSYIINIKLVDHIDALNKQIFFTNKDNIPLNETLRKNITMYLTGRII